jgi:integrase
MFGADGTLAILECRNTQPAGRKTLLTPSEFKALVEVADTQWRAILHLALNAALSNADIAAIRWEHLDLDNRLMVFPRVKNGRMRQTPLADATVAALQKWKKQTKNRTSNVFLTWQGTKWVDGTDSIAKHFDLLKDAVKKRTGASIPATFKSLRKTASSCAMQRLGNEIAVDMLLGHAPNKSWRHYVGFAPDFLREATDAIASEFFRSL